MAVSPTPLWQVVREALNEKGLSVRRAAAELEKFDDRQTKESWKRTLNRALDEDAEKPYAPNRETAEVLARFFGKPDGYFVRPQQRETTREELAKKTEENLRLRQEIAELQQRLAGTRKAAGGSGGR